MMTFLRRFIAAALLLFAAALPAHAQFENQATFAGAASGTNAQAITLNNMVSLVDIEGVPITWVPTAANTGATTLAINSGSATAIQKPTGSGLAALSGAELQSGQPVMTLYNGTVHVLLSINGKLNTPAGNPTVQRFTSGSAQTYTPTAGMVRIKVTMSAGGGGGSGATANNGSNGGDTSFGTWTAVHGVGGTATGNGGAGGSGGTNGTGTLVNRVGGGSGQGGTTSGQASSFASGNGGNNPLGGAGGGIISNGAGIAAAANSGGGGSGGVSNAGTQNCGSGGGAGEYVQFWMTAAQVGASLTYTVGTGGNGGAAGGNAGGNGAAGIIVVEEFYS